MLLENRTAIVSGIGPGMGRDISLAFAREGANLVLAARTAGAVEELAAEIRAQGRRAIGVATDIARDGDAERLVSAAVAEFGHVDVLVNNAFKGPSFKRFEDDDLASWRAVFDVNVFGALRLTQLVIPHMKQRGGSIVFINTMSTRIIEEAAGSYASSKGALLTAAQTLARELGRHRIRVNSIVPGYIWGKSVEGYFRMLAKQRGTTPEAVHAEIAAQTALNHIPTSAEIADAVLFLASDLSRVVTGQALDVNGGHYFH
ncbi:MAG: SDR family oxidoreductase [Alphaproteobacteria bacterium]